ncbi:hypothetical protein TNCT_387001 [Trichonephila clavata]|uniref:TAZ-type domain-containing protein n=1 Tax=Trichonephila clavata TaxID=2740835 RepID=A0A8X6KXU9_TRICU|nr:hypothetical protein TNCT_387001 [Trichonephila clavata]
MSLPTVNRKRSRLLYDVGSDLGVIFNPVNIEHASICKDLNCRSEACRTTKAQFFHFPRCLGVKFCDECECFFNVLVDHASSCEVERCPVFLCETMVELKRCSFPGAEESMKETNPVPSTEHPVILHGYGYPNLSEKLFTYIQKKKIKFKKAFPRLSRETVSSSVLDTPPNIPSTSRDASQGKGDKRRRSNRLQNKRARI